MLNIQRKADSWGDSASIGRSLDLLAKMLEDLEGLSLRP